jgi:hypothetical protein
VDGVSCCFSAFRLNLSSTSMVARLSALRTRHEIENPNYS